MASQRPRPPWFRFSSIVGRAPAPAPSRPPAPAPAAVRPSIPIRPSQTQEPVPRPSQQPVASPPPLATAAAAPPPAPAAAPPMSPVAPTAAPPPPPPPASAPAPPSSPVRATAPQPSPPRALAAAAPPRSPVAQPSPAAAQPKSPIPQPAQPFPPAAPTPAPPSATKSPQRTSSYQKETLITSKYASPSSFSVSTPPKIKSQAPPSSTRASPVPRPVATGATSEAANVKATSPISSPKIIKPLQRTLAESPKSKPLSRPPSPLILPPAQIKSDGEREAAIEQKTILMQQTIDKPIKMPRAHNNAIASNGKREPTAEDLGLRVITLAGENKGALMELSPSHKKNYHVSNPQILRKNGDRSSSENVKEGKSRNKGKANGETAMQSPMTAYFNSNVQGFNNSIVCNSTSRHNDPGIHLSLRKANGRRFKD